MRTTAYLSFRNQHTLLSIFLIAALIQSSAFGGSATVTIDPASIVHTNAPLLLGTSLDARSSFTVAGIPVGYYNPIDGSPLDNTAGSGVTWMWETRIPHTAIRYPQGPVNIWDWKATVGPVSSRAPQVLAGNQVAAFGLDEAMSMAARTGIAPQNIHFMVNIYGPFNVPNLAVAIQDAADLVEYLNLPAGQGYYWADQRSANGHPQPYGIELFNLGNEPWAQSEYDFLTTGASDPNQDGALRYSSDAGMFIAAMKAIDPAIKITLSATSPRNKPDAASKARLWNQTLLQQLGNSVHGLVTNLYYDSESPEVTQRGVASMKAFLDVLSSDIQGFNAANGADVQLLIGEHGHSIDIDYTKVPPVVTNADFAMQWHGAVATTDFLMMLSNRNDIERAHHFIWGNCAATWHPIRLNGDGTYTFLPVPRIYESLTNHVLQNAISAVTTSPAGSDGHLYSVGAGAFASTDGSTIGVVIVNRDPGTDHTVDVSGTRGYKVNSASILTAASPDAEIVTETTLSLRSLNGVSLPHSSIILLQLKPAKKKKG